MNILDEGIRLHTSRVFTSLVSLAADVPEWTDEAVCASTDPDLFHVEKGGSVVPAKRICDGCPVRGQCLAWIMRLEGAAYMQLRFGVYGGLGPTERFRLYKNGWRPGDPTPPVRIDAERYGKAGTCTHCGCWYARLSAHVHRAHGHLGGAA